MSAAPQPQGHPARIQAIPTFFDGYYFRSRLEARWATFLKAMDMEYLYEPEGYKLSDGTCYLPDFYLPVVKAWAEVKPEPPSDEEQAKANGLVLGTEKTLIWLIGPPECKLYCGVEPGRLYTDDGDSELFPSEWEVLLDIYQHNRRYYDREHRFFGNPGGPIPEEDWTREYRAAVIAARCARFDGKQLPRLGYEPFNLTDRELGENW